MSTQIAERSLTAASPAPRGRGAARIVGAAVARYGLRGVALLYLGAAIALPLAAVVSKGFGQGLTAMREALATPGAWEAIRLTLLAATLTAVINAVFGTLIAYVLVRMRFPGRGLVGAIVDIPFAIPTLVTGVMLVALYGPTSPVGAFLADRGINIIFAQPGIVLALLFVTLPLVVRTVQPVLLELDPAEEEASRVLGAKRWATFRRVMLPALRPAISAGGLLAFARALGEFGAIVVVSGNLTGKTLTAPVFIFQLTGQFRYEEAAAVASFLFVLSFLVVLVTTRLVRNRSATAP